MAVYQDDLVTLYCGRMEDIVPHLGGFDAIITDPPYGETSLAWDRWPDGWPSMVKHLAPQMWCFGSLRMFWNRAGEFADWKLAQDVVWEKQNGTGAAADRFRRVHELVVHLYQGAWGGLYRKVPRVEAAARPTAGIKTSGPKQLPHFGKIGGGEYHYTAERLMRSVIQTRNCQGYAVHPTQKPRDLIRPLLESCVPAGGSVLDVFAGSGSTLVEARAQGLRAVGIEGCPDNCAAAVKRLTEERRAA